MSIDSDVYDLMRVNAGVAALLGSGANFRMFPSVIAQGVQLPAGAYAIATEGIPMLDGTVALYQTRVIVQCWAETIASAKSVADAVQAAFAAATPPVPLASRDGVFDAELGLHVETVEFDWWS